MLLGLQLHIIIIRIKIVPIFHDSLNILRGPYYYLFSVTNEFFLSINSVGAALMGILTVLHQLKKKK